MKDLMQDYLQRHGTPPIPSYARNSSNMSILQCIYGSCFNISPFCRRPDDQLKALLEQLLQQDHKRLGPQHQVIIRRWLSS